MSSYLGVPPQSGFITTAKQRITSSTNNYVDLDHSISSLADVIVWVNFVKQSYTNLTLTTSTRITLGATLVASDVVEIAYLGKAVATQTPDTGTVTNDMLAGSIANSKLANSSITLNGSAVSLGGSATVGGNNTPAFLAYKTSNQTVSNTTFTKVTFDAEQLDSDSKYDTSNSRFTPTEVGYYFIGAIWRFDTATDFSSGRFVLYKNGSSVIQSSIANQDANGMTFSAIIYSDADDYFEMYARQNSGGDVPLNGNATYLGGSTQSQFFGFKLIGV